MIRRGNITGLTLAAVAVGLAGCAGLGPVLDVPDGHSTTCSEPGQPDAIWFGSHVHNVGSRPVTLTAAQLGDASGAKLLEILAIPEVTTADGDTLLLGSARDLEQDTPELWKARQPLVGYRIEPGQYVSVAFRVTRAAGAATADVTTQIITHRVDGELWDRTSTARTRFVIAPDCDTIGD